jgi:epoxyqueuosine reductase
MYTALATDIKSFATNELGFDLVGITTAEPLAGGEQLQRWVASGAHGEMAYMASTSAVRADPRLFMPGARSVVCVAMSYHEPLGVDGTAAALDRAIIARYARRRDYHAVLRARLVRLGRFLAGRAAGTAWRPAVDTAPLLEKELAQRAGLGWIGKNTCLINRKLGGELLLGELVTTLQLPPDEPETGHCGTCMACLDTCPTRAFDSPGHLNARLCISYATIEHRGDFPAAVLGGLGGHVFGCDICQTVCPWNRRAVQPCNPALATREQLGRLTQGELERLNGADWAALVAGTPLRRLDALRLQRNLRAVSAAAHRRLP